MSRMTIVGGVHGAGKSTLCRELQRADPGARYLTNQELRRSTDAPLSRAQVHAMLREHVQRCFDTGAPFLFEHVMSGHFVDTLLDGAEAHGFSIHLVYLDLPDAATSLARVTARLATGGHDVDRDEIATRLHQSRENFWTKYRSRSNTWQLYDNGGPTRIGIAHGEGATIEITDPHAFAEFHRRRTSALPTS